MATGYTTVVNDETYTFDFGTPPRGIYSGATFVKSYTAPSGKRWVGTGYATKASDGTYVNDGNPGNDRIYVVNDGQTANVSFFLASGHGETTGTQVDIKVNLAAVDA